MIKHYCQHTITPTVCPFGVLREEPGLQDVEYIRLACVGWQCSYYWWAQRTQSNLHNSTGSHPCSLIVICLPWFGTQSAIVVASAFDVVWWQVAIKGAVPESLAVVQCQALDCSCLQLLSHSDKRTGMFIGWFGMIAWRAWWVSLWSSSLKRAIGLNWLSCYCRWSGGGFQSSSLARKRAISLKWVPVAEDVEVVKPESVRWLFFNHI